MGHDIVACVVGKKRAGGEAWAFGETRRGHSPAHGAGGTMLQRVLDRSRQVKAQEQVEEPFVVHFFYPGQRFFPPALRRKAEIRPLMGQIRWADDDKAF